MSRYLRQLARETHSRLAPPSALGLGPLAPALFQEIHEERAAPELPTDAPAKRPAIAPQQFSPPAPPRPDPETRTIAPPPSRPPAPAPQSEASRGPRLTPASENTEAAVTWEFLQELSDTFVGPNAAPIEPAVKTARNIAAEPLRPSHRPNAEPAHTIQEQLDVTIGRIDVTIESEPLPAFRAQRREPRSAPSPKPAPQSATGRLARQYLDR